MHTRTSTHGSTPGPILVVGLRSTTRSTWRSRHQTGEYNRVRCTDAAGFSIKLVASHLNSQPSAFARRMRHRPTTKNTPIVVLDNGTPSVGPRACVPFRRNFFVGTGTSRPTAWESIEIGRGRFKRSVREIPFLSEDLNLEWAGVGSVEQRCPFSYTNCCCRWTPRNDFESCGERGPGIVEVEGSGDDKRESTVFKLSFFKICNCVRTRSLTC